MSCGVAEVRARVEAAPQISGRRRRRLDRHVGCVRQGGAGGERKTRDDRRLHKGPPALSEALAWLCDIGVKMERRKPMWPTGQMRHSCEVAAHPDWRNRVKIPSLRLP